MPSLELRFSWQSWLRVGSNALVALLVGVLALTPDAPWVLRIVCGAWFLLGAYLTIDALVFARSWRLTERALHVPSLSSRSREISGEALSVELTGGRRPKIRVSGARGSRLVGINPLVAGRDVRRWFDRIPAD